MSFCEAWSKTLTMLTVYGIRQCDTCRKALKWLDGRNIEHRFHDFRTDGLSQELVAGWQASSFAPKLLNRRSTTWRQLTDVEREFGGEKLNALLLAHPTLIKRPVFVTDEIIAVGFLPAELEGLLA
jgi:Spx/MgsR family transcriptional regulator